MGYDWAGEFWLIAIVTGGNMYMVVTTKVYVELTEPTAYNTRINKSNIDYQQDKNSLDYEVLSETW